MLFSLRLILALLWIAIASIISCLLFIFRPRHPNNAFYAARMVALMRFILGVKIEIRNAHFAQDSGPCVIVSNHQDNLDILPGGLALPRKTVTVGKKSLLYFPFFGLLYWLSGNILIDRKNKKSALETMDTVAEQIISKKISVWIMPEGTRSRGRGLMPFKKGAFYTAIKAKCPVVPCVFSPLPMHLDFNKIRAGKIIVEFLPPIQTGQLSLGDVQLLTQNARAAVEEKFHQLSSEMHSSQGKYE